MGLTCQGGFGCSVGGQSTTDQSPGKEKQLNCSCVCVCVCVCAGVCRVGGCVFEGGWRGESAAYYGQLYQNMSLLRNGWFSTSRLFSVKRFLF